MAALKMWIGNLDGSRAGLVIASTKKRAIEIIGCGRTDFERYWNLQSAVREDLEAETLHTRKIDPSGRAVWFKGRVPL